MRTLDPKAREFRPGNHNNRALFISAPPLPQFYYPYPQPEPFGNVDYLSYPQFPITPLYLNPPVQVPVPVHPISPSPVPTRSLLLSSVPVHADESIVRMDLEMFGDIRWIQFDRLRDGIVIVHFYDLRHADKAFQEIRNQHSQPQKQLPYRKCNRHSRFPPSPGFGLIAGSAVWAQFIIPARNVVPGGSNQGTIIIFNLDFDVSSSTLIQIFQRFGHVKELRETPLKKNQKFIEFFDVRDAVKALHEMNGREINGKPVVIEFGRPGGHGKRFFNPIYTSGHRHPSPPRPLKLSGLSNPDNSHRRFYSSREQFFPKKQQYLNSQSGSLNNENNAEKLILNGEGGEAKPRISLRLRKNVCLKKSDPQFLISEDGLEFEESQNLRDSRTTLMIKNIPNKYCLRLIMKMLDKHCIECKEQIDDAKDLPFSSYDFVYLPIDFKNKCNVGYGFVNMTSPQGAWRFYKAFHLHPWELFNSRKICQVTYAKIQGLKALEEHFRKSKFPSEMEEFELPVVFRPPRDGIQLTEPVVVVRNINIDERPCLISSTPNSSPSQPQTEEEDEILGGNDTKKTSLD